MHTKKVNLEITAGYNYDLKITYRDNNGVAITITGATGQLVFKKSVGDAAVGTIVATLGAETGEIEYKFVPADTSTLLGASKLKDVYQYAAEMTLVSGEKYILIEGSITVKRGVV